MLTRQNLAYCCLGLATAFGSAPCRGESRLDVSSTSGALDFATAVDDAHLAGVRGGFDLGPGLLVSFGIERAVYVNGALVTTTGFNVGALGAVTATNAPADTAQGLPASKEINVVSAVQNGTANIFRTEGGSSALPATIVQNTLNGQTIRAVTTINAVSNSLNVLKSTNLGATLGQAIGAAVGSH